jgi:hypothetical protein
MENFEAILGKATAKGANIVPGAIMGVVDSQGTYVYHDIVSPSLRTS